MMSIVMPTTIFVWAARSSGRPGQLVNHFNVLNRHFRWPFACEQLWNAEKLRCFLIETVQKCQFSQVTNGVSFNYVSAEARRLPCFLSVFPSIARRDLRYFSEPTESANVGSDASKHEANIMGLINSREPCSHIGLGKNIVARCRFLCCRLRLFPSLDFVHLRGVCDCCSNMFQPVGSRLTLNLCGC